MQAELGAMELRFAELLWASVPIGSGALVELCAEEFGWKKSTMYTMLGRLCKRGLFQNENGAVTALCSRADYLSQRSEAVVQAGFEGSLPLFLAAFTRKRRLSQEEIDALQTLIDASREDA